MVVGVSSTILSATVVSWTLYFPPIGWVVTCFTCAVLFLLSHLDSESSFFVALVQRVSAAVSTSGLNVSLASRRLNFLSGGVSNIERSTLFSSPSLSIGEKDGIGTAVRFRRSVGTTEGRAFVVSASIATSLLLRTLLATLIDLLDFRGATLERTNAMVMMMVGGHQAPNNKRSDNMFKPSHQVNNTEPIDSKFWTWSGGNLKVLAHSQSDTHSQTSKSLSSHQWYSESVYPSAPLLLQVLFKLFDAAAVVGYCSNPTRRSPSPPLKPQSSLLWHELYSRRWYC